MTRLFAALIALVLMVPLVRAQDTRPSRHARQRVLVIPFATLNDAGKYDWIAHSLQQSLLADLGTSQDIEAIAAAADVKPATDARAAMDEARRADADFVVFGNYQVMDPQVRIRGQVVNVRHDDPSPARLRATGTTQDLFRLEDELTAQIDESIGVQVPREVRDDLNNRDDRRPQDDRAYDRGAQQPQSPYYGPNTYDDPYAYSTPGYSYAYPDYGYVYPSYPYGYGVYGYPFIGARFFGGRFHDSGFHGGFRGSFGHGGFTHGGFSHGGFNHGGGMRGGGHR